MLFLKNTFTVVQPEPPAVQGQVAPLRLRDNVFLGFTDGEIVAEGATLAEFSGNTTQPPATPWKPPVPSLFEWQKAGH